jgi:hypothetical protein
MNRLDIKIQQHTPIIHFQHDQNGATLRASELKPKLDRYLKQHIFKDDFEQYKTYLIGWTKGKSEKDFKDKEAFDYKVRIESPVSKVFDIEKINPRTNRPIQFPLFFGNMGEDNIKKKFVFSDHIITITFRSFNKEILDKIKESFADFLMNTNFGTRQSKGFGSFYVRPNDKTYKPPCGCHKSPCSCFRFSVKPRVNKGYDSSTLNDFFKPIFSDIDLVYKTLRGGINIINREKENEFYFKSMMFKYAKTYGIQWEKKTIKQHYFSDELNDQIEEHKKSDVLTFSSDDSQALMKDVLGLSTLEEWEIPYKAVIKKENPEIKRYRSPILIKVIKRPKHDLFDIFLIPESIPEGFSNKEFTIVKEKNSISKSTLKLKTPISFPLTHFLNFAFHQNLEKHVENEDFRNTWRYRTIKRIYDEIKRNLKKG